MFRRWPSRNSARTDLKAFFTKLLLRLDGHPRLAWMLWCGYAGMIFYVSSQQLGPELDLLPPNTDKLLHAAEYAVFGVLTYHALGASYHPWRNRRLHLVVAIAIGLAYGITDEFHQSFVPTRDSDPRDVVADTIGTAIGAWSLARFRQMT
jgi:VanZ family protein